MHVRTRPIQFPLADQDREAKSVDHKKPAAKGATLILLKALPSRGPSVKEEVLCQEDLADLDLHLIGESHASLASFFHFCLRRLAAVPSCAGGGLTVDGAIKAPAPEPWRSQLLGPV